MKAYERVAAGNYPYFKLASWDAVSLCWRDGRQAFATLAAAQAAAQRPGRYRLSRVDCNRRLDLQPFEII